MNPFDRRWRELVRAARAAKSTPGPEVDPEIGPWLLHRRGAAPRHRTAPDDLWRWYGVRGLAASVTFLLVCLALVGRATREPVLGRPAVENAIAETFWWL